VRTSLSPSALSAFWRRRLLKSPASSIPLYIKVAHSVIARNRHCDDTIRYDTRRYFNVRSKADMSRLNLPHGNDN